MITIRRLIATITGISLGVFAYYNVSQTNVSNQLVSTRAKVEESVTKETPEAGDKKQQEKHPDLIDLTDEVVVLLNGPIGGNGLAIAATIRKASREDKPIWLLIDSPGGSVIVGAQILSAIESAGVQVNTVCLTLCASMAAIIHQYGTTRYMVDRSFLMFHEASGGVRGTVPQMLSQLTSMTRYLSKMSKRIAERAGMSFEEFNGKLASELWLDAEEASSSGFNDKVAAVHFLPEKAVNPQQELSDKAKPTNSHQILNIEY
jgi:ATP-dependent Clp protease protease subunit